MKGQKKNNDILILALCILYYPLSQLSTHIHPTFDVPQSSKFTLEQRSFTQHSDDTDQKKAQARYFKKGG